jgi:deoxycytidylate deaminase
VSETAISAISTSPSANEKPRLTDIGATHTDELIVALCGPIGSGHREVASELKALLEDQFAYSVQTLKLSDIIKQESNLSDFDDEFERIRQLQKAGNELRKKYGNDYLTARAIEIISIDREEHRENAGKSYYPRRRVCFIIDSIKNIAEYNLLFTTYREMFYCFGVYSPLQFREEMLKSRDMSVSRIHDIIDHDSGEEIAHGQQVRDTFVKSDMFIRNDSANRSVLSAILRRYLHLIFGTEIITPTSAESAMHHAWVASANSACLSRQVGAALTDENGGLISVGWNDVPRYGGGLYQSDNSAFQPDSTDQRCFNFGMCYNDEEKTLLAKELFEALVKNKIITDENRDVFIESVRKTKLQALLEFSRSIHAELHSLLCAIRSEGERVTRGKLFVTTYPCHACARHIIAAGISEVYYIEPYRKSLAIKLHKDAITENEQESGKVKILPYSGVSPSKYLAFFTSMGDNRKTKYDGKIIKTDTKSAMPVLRESTEGFPTRESIVVGRLEDSDQPSGGSDGGAA